MVFYYIFLKLSLLGLLRMVLSPYVFTSSEIGKIELIYAQTYGGHCYDLMQRAGEGVYRRLLAAVPRLREAWIFVGRGNNGGGGPAILWPPFLSSMVTATWCSRWAIRMRAARPRRRLPTTGRWGHRETALPAGGNEVEIGSA